MIKDETISNNYKIDIREFLDVLDFDLVWTNSHCKLVDLQGVNIGGIEDEIYRIDEYTFANLVDRLDMYITDYLIDDFSDNLDFDCSFYSYKELYYLAKKIKSKPDRDYFRTIFKALSEPNKYFKLGRKI